MAFALSYMEQSFYYMRRLLAQVIFSFLCGALKCAIYYAFIELN